MTDQIIALQCKIIWEDGGNNKWSTLGEGDPEQLINETLPFYKKFHIKQIPLHSMMEGHEYRLIKYEVIDDKL